MSTVHRSALEHPPEICVAVPPTAHTLAGFEAWVESPDFPEHGRIEFCDGEVLVDMSPERAESHALVKGEIYHVLKGLVRERDLGMVFVDGPGYTNELADIRTRPDGLFFRWSTYRKGKVRGGVEGDRPLGYAGVVDWILEVISPSSVRKDRERLHKKYEQAGVSEYWIVDARDGVIEFDIHVLTERGYRSQPSDDGWRRSEVFDATFRLECVENVVGLLDFTLRVR